MLFLYIMGYELSCSNMERSECHRMQKLGEKIYFSKGTETNLKITTADDLKIFEALLAAENSRKAGMT